MTPDMSESPGSSNQHESDPVPDRNPEDGRAAAIPDEYRDLGKVLGGSFARSALRGILKIIVAGVLAPQLFGIFRSVYSLFRILAGAAEFGLDYATVTLVGAAVGRTDDREKDRILSAVLALKLLIVAALAVVVIGCARMIAVHLLSDAGLTPFVQISVLAVAGHVLWKYVASYLSALQEYTKLALFFTTAPTLMLTVTAGLIAAESFSLSAVIMIYLFGPAAGMLIWMAILRRDLPMRPRWHRSTVARLVRFSRWVFYAKVTSDARGNINPLFLKNAHLSGSAAAGATNAGIYSFGADLADEISVLTQSLFTVLLPKAAGKRTAPELAQFIRKAYRRMMLVLPLLIVPLFLVESFIRVLGSVRSSYLEYLPSLEVFTILYIAALISLMALPMRIAYYAIQRPQLDAYLSIAGLIVAAAGALLLIPRYGSAGAATALAAQRVLTAAVFMIQGARTLKRLGAGELG